MKSIDVSRDQTEVFNQQACMALMEHKLQIGLVDLFVGMRMYASCC